MKPFDYASAGCDMDSDDDSSRSTSDQMSHKDVPERQLSDLITIKYLSMNYKLGDHIGSGAYAKVRMAQNRETGERVAVKIIEKRTCNN